MKPLLQLNIFLTAIEKYYSINSIGHAYAKADYILTMKKEVAKIAAFETRYHPGMILRMRARLLRLLPSHHNPVYFIYKTQLTEVFTACANIEKTVTA